MFKRILLATDGSKLSRNAVAGAIEMAVRHGSELVAFTVVPAYPQSFMDGVLSFSPEDVGRIEKQWADRAETVLDGVRSRATASEVRVKTASVKSDKVAESIIAAARKHHSDLIVMASHGRKGIKRLLLGSETQHVLTHSNLPVLVLR